MGHGADFNYGPGGEPSTGTSAPKAEQIAEGEKIAEGGETCKFVGMGTYFLPSAICFSLRVFF